MKGDWFSLRQMVTENWRKIAYRHLPFAIFGISSLMTVLPHGIARSNEQKRKHVDLLQQVTENIDEGLLGKNVLKEPTIWIIIISLSWTY